MLNNPTNTSREARYGVTRKKHITVTKEGCLQIERWAEEQGLNFSTAIESLALMAIGTDGANALPALTSSLLERIVHRQFNRFAHLLSQAAIAAESASWKTDYLMLQLIRQEAKADPTRFVQNMAVSTDPQDMVASRIRKMRDEIAIAAQKAALRAYKKRIGELQILTAEMSMEEADEQ